MKKIHTATLSLVCAILLLFSVTSCSHNKDNESVKSHHSSSIKKDSNKNYYIPLEHSKKINVTSVQGLIGKKLAMPEDAYSAYYLFLDPNGTFQLRESTTFGNPKTYHNYDLPDGDIPPTFSDTIFEGNYTVINSDIISLVSDSTAIFSYDNDNYLNNPTRKRIVASKFNVDFTRSQDQSYFAQKYPQVSTGGIAQDYNVKIKLSIYKGMAIAGISQVGINTGDIKYYIYHSDGKRDPQSLEQLYNFDVVYNHSLY